MANSSKRVLAVFCLSVAATVGCLPSATAAPSGGVGKSSPAESELTSVSPSQTAAQLTSEGCDEFEGAMRQRMAEEIRAMREKMTASFQSWRQEQTGCWQEYQENERFWKEMGGDSYGVGGLGLSGIGEGGGGRGEGIGLGSIGTIGYGGGALDGSLASQSPRGRRSQTNVQVEGVDEADIVKTDGKHVYFAVNGALRIATVEPPRIVSVTALAGRVKELFLFEKRVVVYVAQGGTDAPSCTYGYDCELRGDGSHTKMLMFDVAHPEAPRLQRSIELSGSLIAARRIGSTVHTVVVDGEQDPSWIVDWPDDMPRCGVYEAAVKARLARLTEANEWRIRNSYRLPTVTENGKSKRFCDVLLKDPEQASTAYVSIYSLDMSQDAAQVHGTSIQSRPGTVFAGTNALYLAVQRHAENTSDRREDSHLHKFRIGKEPSLTKYLASTSIPGRVLNQFSMDEWQGDLRIATTRGHLPDPDVESQVLVLREQSSRLVRIGAIEHLARGEDIRSVRFDAERAYVVTFKKTDPLFVLDFSDARAPKVLGELKIPGFSTYLHRLDPNHLLAIGFDADDQGDFAYFNGLLLQLFDVSHPTAPKLLHREKIGTRGSGSEAATNHLAFNFLPEDGLLAIPTTLCEGGGNGQFGNRLSFAGLLIYNVDLEHGFRKKGGINHGTAGSSCAAWWSQSSSAVKRSLFLDEQVWSIALDRVKVQNLATLGREGVNLRLN